MQYPVLLPLAYNQTQTILALDMNAVTGYYYFYAFSQSGLEP